MGVHLAVSDEELTGPVLGMTVKEVRKQFKGYKGLVIETLPGTDKVTKVSWETPCLVCGKHHRLFSKADKRCRNKLVGALHGIVNSDSEEIV